MFSEGLSPDRVSPLSGISISCVYRYGRAYSNVWLSEFLTTDYHGYWGRLSSVEMSLLRAELKKNVYTDTQSVSVWIRDTFAVSYTVQSTVDLLNRIGFTYRSSL